MSAQNKILLVFLAIVAFALGIAFNTTRVSNTGDAQVLLTAKLEKSGGSGSVGEQLGKLTLVNFWASWCAPCREEMPVFEMMYRGAKNDGFQIIGVAIDSPEKALPMLDSMNITYPILYAEQTGMEVMAASGNPEGLMPYSLLLDQDGKILENVLGKIDERQIAAWLSKYLSPTPQN